MNGLRLSKIKNLKKSKLKEKTLVRLDKRASKPTNISLNEKSSESHNSLDTNKVTRCMFEVLLTAHECCYGLINTDSGANRLILRMCAWFYEIDKKKNHIYQLQINRGD